MKRTALMLVSLVVVALLMISGPSSRQAVAKKGSGGGGGDPPPAPSFRYQYVSIHDDDLASQSEVKGLNNHGDVVGYYQPVDGGVSRAFIGNVLEGMVDLNSFVDPADNVLLRGATAINDSCQVTGYGYYRPDPDTRIYFAYRFTPPSDGAQYGTVDTINGLGNQVNVTAINDDGDMAGHIFVDGVWWAFICIATDDGLDDPVLISPLASQSYGLSNRLDGALMSCGTTHDGRAWRFTGEVGNLAQGTLQDLGTLRSDNTGYADAQDINDSGQVAGTADADPTKGNENSRAYRDTPGASMLNLGTLATSRDWNDSSGYGLNNQGEVVGMSLYNTVPQQRAFVYLDQFGILDLTQLTDGVPAELGDYFVPRDINDLGDIAGPYVGGVVAHSGVPKAFLLMRVPAP